MKLDKIKFAKMLWFIGTKNADLEPADIEHLDNLIYIDVPEPVEIRCNVDDLHMLMVLMHEGNSKIEAIKYHRKLTGYGLKDSKDIVEKYWRSKDAFTKADAAKILRDSGYNIAAKLFEPDNL